MNHIDTVTECKPKDQCVPALPDKDVELLPGMINVMNNQGCCPSFKTICAPKTCPLPKPCPLYYEQISVNNHSCCEEFKCGNVFLSFIMKKKLTII